MMEAVIKLEIITCANCSMNFGVPEKFREKRREDHETFYCPAGHSNYYPAESDKEKLEKKIQELQSECEKAWKQYHEASARTEAQKRSKRALKANYTRLKRKLEKCL